MGFSGSSATNYIGAFYSERLSSGFVLNLPRVIQLGLTEYSGQWRDYSATTIDPADDWSFWTVQAYAAPSGFGGSHSWATVITKARPNP